MITRTAALLRCLDHHFGLLASALTVFVLCHHRRALIPSALTAVCLAGHCWRSLGNQPVNVKAAAWTPAMLPPDWPS